METPLSSTLVAPGASSAAPALRPLGIGEILDRALQLFRANFLRLLTIMIVFQAPIYAVNKALQLFLRDKAPVLSRPGAFRGQLPSPEQLGWFLLGSAVALALSLILVQLSVASLTSAASRAVLGERIEAGLALREGLKRAPQVIGTFLLLLLWCGLLLTLSAVPGGVLAVVGAMAASPVVRVSLMLLGLLAVLLALLVVGLYLMLRYALVAEVVVIERVAYLRALKRSAALMTGRIGPTFFESCKVRASIVYAVNLAIGISVSVVTSIPLMIVNSAFGTSPLNPETYDPALVPLWASVPVEVFQVFAQAAIAPFGLLAIIVFYFDLRIRREGFDLELLAARLGEGR